MSILDNLQLLADLTQKEKDNFALFCQEKIINAGEVLFKEGDEANAMYILAKGSIEISHYKNDENIVLGQVDSEEILGEMALFGSDSCRMATATAIEDSKLITILSFSIKEMITKHPELLEKIKKIIEERVIENKMK